LIELVEEEKEGLSIKIIGVGGAGGNAVSQLAEYNPQNFELIAINTDAQALAGCKAPVKLQIGENITGGRGTGGDVEAGRKAASEDRARIEELVAGADLVFITAGLGGGTGTGASPVIADLAKQAGALVIGVVTKPFEFEGEGRARIAQAGVDELLQVLDTLIVVPNERLMNLVGEDAPIVDAFNYTNRILLDGVQGITDLVTSTGLINLDFADIRAVMEGGGFAMLGVGEGEGEDKVRMALDRALNSHLIEHSEVKWAEKILLNITGGRNLTSREVREITTRIREAAPYATITFGIVINEEMEGRIKIIFIATGLEERELPEQEELQEIGIGEGTQVGIDRAFFEDELDIPTFLRKGKALEG